MESVRDHFERVFDMVNTDLFKIVVVFHCIGAYDKRDVRIEIAAHHRNLRIFILIFKQYDSILTHRFTNTCHLQHRDIE